MESRSRHSKASNMAFISATPVPTSSSGRHSRGSDRRRANTCKVRPSASASPPPPPPPSQKPEDDGASHDDHVGKLSETRSALEKALGAEMASKKEGSGQCACIWCNGAKERRCSWCEGRGVRYEIVAKSWEELKGDLEKMQSGEAQFMKEPEKVPVRCSACSGSKKLRCAYCRGSGVGSYGHAY